MKKSKLLIIPLVVMMLSFAIAPVLADTIRIEPHGSYYPTPIMLSSPATFYTFVEGPQDGGTYEVHVLLVMTNASFYSLTGDTTVTWNAGSNSLGSWTAGTVTIHVADWNGPESDNGVKLPPGVEQYTVGTLKGHLATDEPLYWYWAPIIDGAKLEELADPNDYTTGIPFTITLPAAEPRMAVWLIGTNPGSDSGTFDNFLPNTRPGFVVPEPAAIIAAAMSLSAFAGYALIKRKGIKTQ